MKKKIGVGVWSFLLKLKKKKIFVPLYFCEFKPFAKFANIKGSQILRALQYRSEMARNEIESYFRTSKMATGSHFVTQNKKKIKNLY